MAQKDEVKPSGQALKQAAKWLGVSDPAKLLDDDPAAAAFQPRPEGLGLGAKFLAHHKAAHLTMPLEKRFGKRLQRSSANDEEATNLPLKKAQQNSDKQVDSSDEEEVGRSGAFSRKKPSHLLKGQLLLPGQHSGKQKAKKR